MIISVDARGTNVTVTADRLIVDLEDGRTISVPIAWYPRLARGTMAERQHWEWLGPNTGIRWEALDEDILVEGLLQGAHYTETPEAYAAWRAKYPIRIGK